MSETRRYDAILFDLGKVLIPFDFSFAFQAMERATGVAASEIRSRLAGTDLFVRFETGSISPHDFIGSVSALFDTKFEEAQFAAIWNSIFLPEPLVPESLISGLRSMQPTYIVSNTNAIHFEMLRRTYSILSHFDGYVLSYEIHAMKPAAEFYDAALRIAGVPSPDRTLFIDDLPENVAGARAAGMDGIVFKSAAQLGQELSLRGFEINRF